MKQARSKNNFEPETKRRFAYIFQLLLAVVVLGPASQVSGQTHPPFKDEHWNGHFGVIKITPTSPSAPWPVIGSAFVYGPRKDVVTCAHVVVEATKAGGTNLFYVGQSIGVRALRLKYMLPRYDMAVFATDGEIAGEPMKIADFKKIRPGDKIRYYGYDSRQSTSAMPAGIMNEATVTATGSTLNNGITVEFLEFDGVGIPGYSGGPVFNESGELVAIMREAWMKQGVKGGPTTLMNRAFSLEMLQLPDEPVITSITFAK